MRAEAPGRPGRWRRGAVCVALAAGAVTPVVVTAAIPVAAVVGGGVRAQAELPEPTHEPAEARARADEILARPEFQPARKSIVERALDWVGGRIGDVISAGASSGGGLVGWLILAGLVAAVVAVVRRIRPVARAASPAPEPTVLIEEVRSARAWREAAAAHEAAGAWLEALRCHYQALVAELVERELLDDVPGRTVGEYRDELAVARPSARPAFVDATNVYEDAWYGTGEASPDDTRRFSEGAEQVLAEVAR